MKPTPQMIKLLLSIMELIITIIFSIVAIIYAMSGDYEIMFLAFIFMELRAFRLDFKEQSNAK